MLNKGQGREEDISESLQADLRFINRHGDDAVQVTCTSQVKYRQLFQ